MKVNLLYDLNVLLTIIKKEFYKLLFVFLVFLSFILIYIFSLPIEITNYSLDFALGILFQKNFLGILWLSFQILMTMYFSYLFFFYEINNSFEFVFLRIKRIPFLVKKYFVLETVVILSRVLLYTFLSTIFFKNLEFNNISFALNIIVHLMISSLMFIIFMLFKQNA